MLEREEQSPLGSLHATPHGLVPPRRERPLHHRASVAFRDSSNAPVILDATLVLRDSVTLIVSRLCGRGYAIGSLERVLDGLAFCDRDQAGLPMHPHHRVE